MTNFIKLFSSQRNYSADFIKRMCFLNNVRSKYLTIFLILSAFAFSLYDVMIFQKTNETSVFLFHIKADIIFLVFSFIFTLYIFFNQVKTHHNIDWHHKYIHGIISLFILLWSVYKSILFIKFNDGSYNLAIIGLLITCFLYVFPLRIYLGQISISILFAFIVSLLFNLTLTEIINTIYILVLISILFAIIISLLFHLTLTVIINTIYILALVSVLAFIISQNIFYLQHRILLKEREIIRYRKKINVIN